MNIIELIRRDNERSLDQFDRVDKQGSARGRRRASGLFPHSSRWGDPDDMEDSPLLQYLAEVNSREVSLEELDDRFAVDRWLRETAGG